MRTNIISIGNSKGIRIPKPLLEESGLGEEVELKAKRGELRIVPLPKRKTMGNSASLSEKVLATDWNRDEENSAWESLQ